MISKGLYTKADRKTVGTQPLMNYSAQASVITRSFLTLIFIILSFFLSLEEKIKILTDIKELNTDKEFVGGKETCVKRLFVRVKTLKEKKRHLVKIYTEKPHLTYFQIYLSFYCTNLHNINDLCLRIYVYRHQMTLNLHEFHKGI